PLSSPASVVNEADERLANLDKQIADADGTVQKLEDGIKELKEQKRSRTGSAKDVVRLEIAKRDLQLKNAKSDRKKLLDQKVRVTRGRKLGTIGEGAAAGTGQITYAAIQVVDAQNKRIAVEFSETSQSEHAEERIVARLRARFKPEDLKGARITVVTDQKVCEKRCQRALRRFAEEFGVDLVESRYFVRSTVRGGGTASPRTTLRTA